MVRSLNRIKALRPVSTSHIHLIQSLTTAPRRGSRVASNARSIGAILSEHINLRNNAKHLRSRMDELRSMQYPVLPATSNKSSSRERCQLG